MTAINFSGAWTGKPTREEQRRGVFRLIREGIKTTTIRRPRKNPVEAGDKLQLYWGMRTRDCVKIADAVCASTEPILICSATKTIVVHHPSKIRFSRLWREDGFRDETSFWHYFRGGGEYTLIRWKLISPIKKRVI